MSNPITHIIRILLATGGGKREKSKSLGPTRSILCAIARSRCREEGSK
jgi:hypothetical protein